MFHSHVVSPRVIRKKSKESGFLRYEAARARCAGTNSPGKRLAQIRVIVSRAPGARPARHCTGASAKSGAIFSSGKNWYNDRGFRRYVRLAILLAPGAPFARHAPRFCVVLDAPVNSPWKRLKWISSDGLEWFTEFAALVNCKLIKAAGEFLSEPRR